jgi:hypothetical protein
MMVPTTGTRKMEVVRAAEDLRRRTLAGVKDPLERMIYLASMRDYNTGLYHHAGLAQRFGDEVACEALAECHREAYLQLMGSSLESVVAQFTSYADRSGSLPSEIVTTWKSLEPYRVAVPAGADPLAADFVCSNLSIAVSILESRLPGRPLGAQPGASPRPSPAQ